MDAIQKEAVEISNELIEILRPHFDSLSILKMKIRDASKYPNMDDYLSQMDKMYQITVDTIASKIKDFK